MKKYERIAALFLTLLGITTGVHAWLNLGLGTMQLPAAGFMPFVASIVLAVSSALWLLGNLSPDPSPRPFWVDKGWLKPLLAFVAIFLYTVLIEPVGYLLATLVFMLLWQFVVEREKWLKATLISVIATAVMWLLFSKLLGVPVPAGLLGL
ncbi:MAG TPA: tripartite tricarboxylate transporter TctB family protein [Symbiobacteriaceae bacterium]|nr:tripartite tricarboxylate transporter TctB family protein [Symbiobacteriaceae bacterium]